MQGMYVEAVGHVHSFIAENPFADWPSIPTPRQKKAKADVLTMLKFHPTFLGSSPNRWAEVQHFRGVRHGENRPPLGNARVAPSDEQ